jgi:hypothetical protein
MLKSRAQSELGDREAKAGEGQRRPDVGEQRAVAGEDVAQQAALVAVHLARPAASA